MAIIQVHFNSPQECVFGEGGKRLHEGFFDLFGHQRAVNQGAHREQDEAFAWSLKDGFDFLEIVVYTVILLLLDGSLKVV